jgi:hypothetical protein
MFERQVRPICNKSIDRELSGFTGSNIANGALGEFIERIEASKIPTGSALFVESPDRISLLLARNLQRYSKDVSVLAMP